MTNHLFVFNIVGLSPQYLNFLENLPAFSQLLTDGKAIPMEPAFPCLTLPGQATLSTGILPSEHGIIANGFYYRDKMEVSFWDQYRSLLQAEPFWEKIKHKKPDCKTAVLFWQNTLYGNADIVITPKPMHADHQLIQWCYSKPVGLYESLAEDIGPFELMHYWGPFASPESSRWITNAAISLLKNHSPDLMMIYLPHLDYSCQKYGPDDPKVFEDLKIIDDLVGNFLNELDQLGLRESSTIAVISEYSITNVSSAVNINLVLREAELLNVREIEGKEYLDIEMSKAFAMVDHQIAHVFVQPKDEEKVNNLLQHTEGIQLVLNKHDQIPYGVNHERSGELLAVSAPDKWFTYYWWDNPEKAPDFANKIDIHRKPGYDPLELFWDHDKMEIPTDPSLIKGSHGIPAKDGNHMAVFLISGNTVKNMELPDKIHATDVASILEKVALEQH